MSFATAMTPPQMAYDGLPDVPSKEVLNLPPSPPPSKRTDSAVSMSSCAEEASMKLQRFVEENAKYDAEWGAYLGLAEEQWSSPVAKKANERSAPMKEEKKSRNAEARYEREWSTYLGLDEW